MAKNDKVLFGSELSIDEVHAKLDKVCSEVKQKGKSSLRAIFEDTRFSVSKTKQGYEASVNIPG